MFGRALIAFLVLPGLIGGIIPVSIFAFDPWRDDGWLAGYIVIGLGCFLLIWCIRDFYLSGKGTLAPWCPPRNLVVVGLYRFLRNPMYISVLSILVGWCVVSGSRILITYTVLVAAMFHIRVTRYEEHWLAKEFGKDWVAYSEAVGRWFPRFSPWFPKHKP